MFKFTPKNRLRQYFERWQTPTDCLPEFGMARSRSSSKPKEEKPQWSEEMAERFKANLEYALTLWPNQKALLGASGVDEPLLKDWQRRGIGIPKVSGPLAKFCQALGIDPDSMWSEEVIRVGPPLVEYLAGFKRYKPAAD